MPSGHITMEEAAQYENIEYKTIAQRVARETDRYAVSRVPDEVGGKDRVLIAVTSLTPKTQRAYLKATQPAPETPAGEPPWYLSVDVNWYIDRNKRAYYEAVDIVKRLAAFAAYDAYGDKSQYANELAQMLGVSQRSLYRMVDQYAEALAWSESLAQQTGESYDHLPAMSICRKPKESGTFPILPGKHKVLIENIWFHKEFARNCCTIEMLYDRYVQIGSERGLADFPSVKTVGRYVNYLMECRSAKSAHYLAARGEREWKNTQMVKAKRDTSTLHAMEYVQGDEHTFDCWVSAVISGQIRAVRPNWWHGSTSRPARWYALRPTPRSSSSPSPR